jgi:hypothetical protein
MDFSQRKPPIVLGRSILLVLTLAGLGGCTRSNDEKPVAARAGQGNERVDQGKSSVARAEASSANCYLTDRDFNKFRSGRSMDDVLKDVQFRGNFDAAAIYEGKDAYSITYFLLPRGATNAEAGEWLSAIFVDNKFTKFVKPPPSLPDEEEEYYDLAYKRKMRRLKPIKVGDRRFLIRAVESPPINIVDLEKELSDRPPAPSHVDPGLTAAFLLLKPALLAISARMEKDSKNNASLRDQFNASRLRIGMTESEVRRVLKASPLESGEVEAGSYEIYGSNDSLDDLGDPYHALHFTNILIVFKSGQVTGIYSVSAGDKWRQSLGTLYSDLPAPNEHAGAKEGMGR